VPQHLYKFTLVHSQILSVISGSVITRVYCVYANLAVVYTIHCLTIATTVSAQKCKYTPKIFRANLLDIFLSLYYLELNFWSLLNTYPCLSFWFEILLSLFSFCQRVILIHSEDLRLTASQPTANFLFCFAYVRSVRVNIVLCNYVLSSSLLSFSGNIILRYIKHFHRETIY
jgi:hypothetical protein